MTMNPPPPAPTRGQRVAITTRRLAGQYAPVILTVGGIVLGFILGRI